MSVFIFIYQEIDAGIIQHGDIIKVLPATIINGHPDGRKFCNCPRHTINLSAKFVFNFNE